LRTQQGPDLAANVPLEGLPIKEAFSVSLPPILDSRYPILVDIKGNKGVLDVCNFSVLWGWKQLNVNAEETELKLVKAALVSMVLRAAFEFVQVLSRNPNAGGRS
jgi:hypothetical protein